MYYIKLAVLRARLMPAAALIVISCLAIGQTPVNGRTGVGSRREQHFDTELFGHKYRLDESKGVAAYIKALDREIARSKREESLGAAHDEDPVHNKLPKYFIDKKLRKSMEATRAVAMEVANADTTKRDDQLHDLWTMAGAIRGAYVRILPPNMDVIEAYSKQNRIKHPPVGLGKAGSAVNLAQHGGDSGADDPMPPSSFWHKRADIASKEMYYGFGRDSLPSLDGMVCTYHKSKQTRGHFGGFEVKCKEFGKVKLKFGEQYSQPVAHRIFWALGFNTIPVDTVATAKVKWDPRILTEYNSHGDETMTVSLLGIPIIKRHLQEYQDPMDPVDAVIMTDEQGKEITVFPNRDWSDFKSKLFKNPSGKPELVTDNFNNAFADRIKYFVYRNVNFRTKDDEGNDDEIFLGNWDWNGEGNPGLRENRGFAFLSAWFNQYDSWVHNNKLYMSEKDGKRTFRRIVTDLGGCLGPAIEAGKMTPHRPNEFPWEFTRPLRPSETAIPLNSTFHNIRENVAMINADVDDARWMAGYMAQITGKQILEALMSSRMPSAMVRVFYNKLVHRRNRALNDLGLPYPAIRQMDDSETFDYDPRKDGLISIVTSRNEKVTAPDDDWVVIKGRAYTRADVRSGKAAKEIAKTTHRAGRPNM